MWNMPVLIRQSSLSLDNFALYTPGYIVVLINRDNLILTHAIFPCVVPPGIASCAASHILIVL